eukprot:m.174425 g.174425  ORF g.174425 m.174425 type:complete len:306 (+) comp14877_c0_seq2:267-1184(+)
MLPHAAALCTCLRCRLSADLYAVLYSHLEQPKGFSPVWIRMCRFKWPFCDDVNPQSCTGQANGFSPLWVLMCWVSRDFSAVLKSHWGQACGFSPEWTRRWRTKWLLWLVVYAQCSHRCNAPALPPAPASPPATAGAAGRLTAAGASAGGGSAAACPSACGGADGSNAAGGTAGTFRAVWVRRWSIICCLLVVVKSQRVQAERPSGAAAAFSAAPPSSVVGAVAAGTETVGVALSLFAFARLFFPAGAPTLVTPLVGTACTAEALISPALAPFASGWCTGITPCPTPRPTQGCASSHSADWPFEPR